MLLEIFSQRDYVLIAHLAAIIETQPQFQQVNSRGGAEALNLELLFDALQSKVVNLGVVEVQVQLLQTRRQPLNETSDPFIR